MHPLPEHDPPARARLEALTAYTLLGTVIVLVGVAASGVLAPYGALRAVSNAQFASLVLPNLPSAAMPLASGLAAQASGTWQRSRTRAPGVDSARGTAFAAASGGSERSAPGPAAPVAPAAPVLGPAAPTPATTPPGIVPTGGGSAVTTVTPPADTPDEEQAPAVIRPAKSQGHAYGVAKKSSPKPSHKPHKISSKTKKASGGVKKATHPTAKKPAPAKKAAKQSEH